MGYSMGARIAAYLAVDHAARVRSAIFGGLGMNLVEGVGMPETIANALEAPSIDDVTGEQARMFRAFADLTKSDRRALAACIRDSRQTLTRAQAAGIRVPVMVAVGTKDTIAGSPEALAALIQDPERRARMGASAMARARSVFDWKAVIPQYQALWRELERRRRAAPVQAPGLGLENPWALDPFRMFAAYPSHTLAHTDTVQLTRAFAPADLAAIMAAPSVRGAESRLPTLSQTEALIAALSHDRPAAVGAILSRFAPKERPFLERGLVWLAKYGLVRFSRVTLKE